MPENDPNVLLGIAGVAVGIAGIIIGIIVSTFFYFRSKSKYLLEHRMKSTQLITKQMTSIPKLEVTVDGQSVESLTSTTIEFINSGNQSILCSDFATKEPLGITITGRLHSYDVSADNPNSTPDLLAFNDKTFHVKFDFLKQKQSFTITLLHDGEVTILGELTNGSRKEYRNRLTDRTYWYVRISIDAVIGIIIGSMLSVIMYNDVYLLKDVLLTAAIPVLFLIPFLSELVLRYYRKREQKNH